MPREITFSKEEAYQKAMALFWQKGYASTSLSDLTEHIGIGKSSFYATFNSKQALFSACFEKYQHTNMGVFQQLLEQETDVKKGLRKLLEFNLEFLLGDDQPKGCFIANSCSEIHLENEQLTNKLVDHYADMEAILNNYLKRGGVAPEKADIFAAMAVTFLIGMSQQSKIQRDRKSYLGTIEQLIGLLD